MLTFRASTARVAACAVGAITVAFGAGCAESELEPQTAVNAQVISHERMKNPDIRDGFMQVAEPSYQTPPSQGRVMPPRHTVSLGYIGDEPLGRYDAESPPPHTPPFWTRPFPPHWEQSFHAPGSFCGRGRCYRR